MARYVALINRTDQGVKGFKESVDRYEAALVRIGRVVPVGLRLLDGRLHRLWDSFEHWQAPHLELRAVGEDGNCVRLRRSDFS